MPRVIYENLHDAFWSNVDAGEKDECWPWRPVASKGHLMHGQVTFNKKRYGAHRLSYMLHHGLGKIPDGMVVMHKCDYPPCCNPGHLEIGTQQDNIQDASKKRRLLFGKRHHRGSALLTPEEVQQIRDLRGVMTYHDIAGAYSISYWTVQAVMNGKRWSDYKDTGDNNQRLYHAERGKLTPRVVREMREMAATGEHTWKALGERFRLDASTVRKVCVGKRWKDAGGPEPMERGQKLTERQAAEIMHMYGLRSVRETAIMYGISEQSVRDMWKCKVKKWRYLLGREAA